MCSPAYTSSGYWQGGLKIPQDWRMHARVKGGYPPTCAGPLMWKQVKVWPTYYGGRDAKYRELFKWSFDHPPLSSSKAVFDQEALLQSSLSLYPMHQQGWLNTYIWYSSKPKLMKLISLNCLPVGQMDSVQCILQWWFTQEWKMGQLFGKLFETPDERCRGGEIGSSWSNHWGDSQLEQLERYKKPF